MKQLNSLQEPRLRQPFRCLRPFRHKLTTQASATQKVVSNLLGHVPTEAVALSTTLAPFVVDHEQAVASRAWTLFAGSLILMVFVRYVNKASPAIWVTSLIAFALWMSLVPYSPLVYIFPWIKTDPVEIVMVSAVFSAIVTVAASAGKLK